MPGPVGGGRSGGGSRGGGFSSGGASHGGGFSSGGSFSPFRSGGYRPVGGFHNVNNNSNNNNDPEYQKKEFKKLAIAVGLFLAFVFGNSAIKMAGNLIDSVNVEPVSEPAYVQQLPVVEEPNGFIPPREKLDAELCTPVDDWYIDRYGLLIDEADYTMVEDGLSYFYEKTGVQPFLLITNTIDGEEYPDRETVVNYLFNLYIKLFNEDEGHYIFLYIAHDDSSYTLYYIPGIHARTVMDDAASELLMDYIEWYYQVSPSFAEMFANAFVDTADAIIWEEEATVVLPDESVAVSVEPEDADATSVVPPPASIVDESVGILPEDESTSALENEAESVITPEVPAYTDESVEVTYYEEPESNWVWEEEVTEEPVEFELDEDTRKYMAGVFAIFAAILLFAVVLLRERKKMRDLERM